MLQIVGHTVFPKFSGVRCLMMPFIQGDPDSVPAEYSEYRSIIETLHFKMGDIGFLTIDESSVRAGTPHRGARSKWSRALHTEAGRDPEKIYCWGDGGHWGGNPAPSPTKTPRTTYGWGNGGGWGSTPHKVTLDRDVRILLASNLDGSCAVWDAEHEDTSSDGDIGDCADIYPYSEGRLLQAGEVASIGILTPHESLPVKQDFNRQFLRVISSGVHGRESYFTLNPLVPFQN